MKYKKPAFLGIMISIVICAVFAVCFLTNPKTYADDEKIETEEKTFKATSEILYCFRNECDSMIFWIVLEPESGTYLMNKSGCINQHISMGNYEFTEDKLILNETNTEGGKYSFDVEDGVLIFDAKNSSEILNFVVGSDYIVTFYSKEAQEEYISTYLGNDTVCESIPDGSRFYLREEQKTRDEIVEAFNRQIEMLKQENEDANQDVDAKMELDGLDEEVFIYEDVERGCLYQVYLNIANNTFKMRYDSGLSYCAASGTYTIKDNKIVLTDSDETEEYVFEVVGGQLVFVENESTEMPLYAHSLENSTEYIWIGRKSDETFDKNAYEKYINDNSYEIIRLINDGDIFQNNILTEEERELQLTYFRESFKEGIVDWSYLE